MASLGTYDAGETVTLQATFRNEAGTLETPTTTTLYIERPDGTVDTIADGSLAKPSAGIVEYPDTAEGRGRTPFRFKGVTGSRTVIEQGYYVVRRQRAAA